MAKIGDEWVSDCGRMILRCGKWQTALADVTECDAVITDPPYGERTHKGQRHGRYEAHGRGSGEWHSEAGLEYACFSEGDQRALVTRWGSASGWLCIFHSHDQRGVYSDAMELAGRYVFAPLACVQRGMNVRLAGDGPSNWTTWLTVARPKNGPITKWGALSGAYVVSGGEKKLAGRGVGGAKPLDLMVRIVRDYSRPGDLIVDPCAGGGTTLLAAAITGRRSIGAELDPETFAKAVKRLSAGYTPSLFNGEKRKQTQEALL